MVDCCMVTQILLVIGLKRGMILGLLFLLGLEHRIRLGVGLLVGVVLLLVCMKIL
jgi:hypothetical protein